MVRRHPRLGRDVGK
jgi:membrane-bound lytic murein transglycosylase B